MCPIFPLLPLLLLEWGWKEICLCCSLWVWASCSQVWASYCHLRWQFLLGSSRFVAVCVLMEMLFTVPKISWSLSWGGTCWGTGLLEVPAVVLYETSLETSPPVCAGQAGGHEPSALCHCSCIGPLWLCQCPHTGSAGCVSLLGSVPGTAVHLQTLSLACID